MKKLIFAILNVFCICGTAIAQQQTTPPPPTQGWVELNSGTTAGFNFISLVGPDTVYVSGDQVLRSTDAGATWQRLTQIPIPVGGRLQFINDTTAFLSGASDSVFKTTDGGMTWRGAYTGLGAGILALFASTKNGITLPGSHMTYTNDGDSTWHSPTGSSGGQYNCMTFADSVHGYGMGTSTYWNNGNHPFAPTFERTSDGGATWEPVYPGPSVDANGHGQPHSGIARDIWGIMALNDDTLYAVGDQIGRSTNGGSDWDTLPDPTSVEHFHGAYFTDNFHGTAVGSDGWIIHTTDAGQTWVQQNSGITDGSYLYDVKFIDSLTGYTVGDEGIILKTTNAGISWVNISPSQVALIQATLSPQPANQQTTLSYNLPEPQYVSVTIQSVTGGVVETILAQVLQDMGPQRIAINTSEFAAGTYFIKIVGDHCYGILKLIVCHDLP